MNEFRIFAHGVEFDPDAYLASAPLKFDGLWRKGESGRDHPKSSGVFKILGDGFAVPIPEQERIAIEYLSANREVLKALGQHPQVTTFVLGLQYHIDRPNIVGVLHGPAGAAYAAVHRYRHIADVLRHALPQARE